MCAALAGCQIGAETGTDPSQLYARISPRADGIWLEIEEHASVVFQDRLSDWTAAMATIDERFAGKHTADGPIVVLHLWEGQNSGDRAVVFGKKHGLWSRWGSVPSATCNHEVTIKGGRLFITDSNGKDGQDQTVYAVDAAGVAAVGVRQ
jgi:hypothetical protein